MRKNLQNKILISLLAAGSIGVCGFMNTVSAAVIVDDHYTGNDNNGVLEITTDLPAEASNVTAVTGKYMSTLSDNTEYANNAITISGGDLSQKDIYGFYYDDNLNDNIYTNNVSIYNNSVTITGGTIKGNVFGIAGAYVEGNLTGNSKIYNNSVYIEGLKTDRTYDIVGAVGASEGITVNNNTVTIKNSTIVTDSFMMYGITGGAATLQNSTAENNTVEIIDSNITMNAGEVLGGFSRGTANQNNVLIKNSTINGAIIGARSTNNSGSPENYPVIASNNTVTISGNSTINGEVLGAYLEQTENTGDIYGQAINNSIILQGTNEGMPDISSAILSGSNQKINGTNVKNNKLTIDGWSGSTQGAYNFSDIDFNNINWQNGGTVLSITNNTEENALGDTNINVNSIAGSSNIAEGDTMTLITGDNLGVKADKITINPNFYAGVATEGTGSAAVNDDGSVTFTVDMLKAASQTKLVAENRAVAAAFINQGTDLISDSLDVISRDGNYGVKTFAAVQGNRSKYDVNSDLKINGWSTIVGVGNAAEFTDGDEFSWGVFYENGSGNYRTFNEFNNEFFRGDGSLVYNGGGIAARYENAHGVYTEGSLRAGMLKSEMDNALRDGNGNNYGYSSESEYYGAHIGIGQIIPLSESSDLDVYGKFFHTYTEGDSFTVANDKFEFDSINSDRLRVGARVTTNKANKFSTYYGLAYEYEFNGDADMRAQNLAAPTQSLQGSSYMAEVGFNYQPTPDSPWNFDLNMRGYAGEREGATFNVQATYTF